MRTSGESKETETWANVGFLHPRRHPLTHSEVLLDVDFLQDLALWLDVEVLPGEDTLLGADGAWEHADVSQLSVEPRGGGCC